VLHLRHRLFRMLPIVPAVLVSAAAAPAAFAVSTSPARKASSSRSRTRFWATSRRSGSYEHFGVAGGRWRGPGTRGLPDDSADLVDAVLKKI
jgi:hypothetical protein